MNKIFAAFLSPIRILEIAEAVSPCTGASPSRDFPQHSIFALIRSKILPHEIEQELLRRNEGPRVLVEMPEFDFHAPRHESLLHSRSGHHAHFCQGFRQSQGFPQVDRPVLGLFPDITHSAFYHLFTACVTTAVRLS